MFFSFNAPTLQPMAVILQTLKHLTIRQRRVTEIEKKRGWKYAKSDWLQIRLITTGFGQVLLCIDTILIRGQLSITLYYKSMYYVKDCFCMSVKQTYSIDVYTDNYLPSFFNDPFRLLPNSFLLLGCVNSHITIGWFSMTQLKGDTRTVRWGDLVI